jgi:hypothetical protein
VRPPSALIETRAPKSVWTRRSSRWAAAAALLLIGAAVLVPTWILLPPDDEGLFLEIASTSFQAKHLFLGWFWNPFVAFGVPEPLSQSLSFHPFLLFARWLSLPLSIGLLYQLQLWVGLASVWAVCRHLGIRTWIALLCVISFALATPTINYLRDFWPVLMVTWTLSPLLLLLVLKLLDGERRSSRAVYGVSAGLCASLMLLDGHAGVFPVYMIGFAAFLAGRARRLREVWPWLALAVLVLALATGTKFFDIALEYVRAEPGERQQQIYRMNWGSLLFYPIPAREHGYRLLAIGGPFFVLAVIGLFYRRVSQRHVNGLRVGTAFSFLAWFFVANLLSPLSGNWFFREPFTLFAIFLAGLTLQVLWDRLARLRPLLLAAAGLQVAVLVWGFYPLYRSTMTRAVDYLQGSNVPSLRKALANQPLYAYFERRPDRLSTRVYMAPGANDRLTRSLADYEFAAWGLHDLRLVNGHFRGIDMHELLHVKETLLSEIWGDTSLPDAPDALDALNIGYVLATPGDRVSPALRRLRTFRLEDSTVIEIFRNPTAWNDAVVLSAQARRIGTLPPRAGCTNPGLLCADFSQVVALRRPDAVLAERWRGTSLEVRTRPSPGDSVLMLSQMFRPGWQARLSNGRTVDGYRLLGGLTGFDLPPGTTSAEISFRPAARMAFAALSWATILASLAFLVAVAVFRRRQGRKGAPVR